MILLKWQVSTKCNFIVSEFHRSEGWKVPSGRKWSVGRFQNFWSVTNGWLLEQAVRVNRLPAGRVARDHAITGNAASLSMLLPPSASERKQIEFHRTIAVWSDDSGLWDTQTEILRKENFPPLSPLLLLLPFFLLMFFRLILHFFLCIFTWYSFS
jgi:hypothetical protein